MAYRLQHGETVPAAIQRIAHEQLEGAIDSLSGKGNRDEGIHDARKRVKKVRALLRLVRSDLGDLFTEENVRLRDAGRGLSAFRDAAVVIETFDEVVEKRHEDLGKKSLDAIRHGLVLHKSRAQRKANVKESLRSISSVLAASDKRVAKWPLTADGFAAIEPGIERAFRRGRAAMAEADRYPKPESFHEWRKRVKDLWYHVRLVEDMWSDVLGGYEKSLKELEDWLGTDHNMAVLRVQVTAEPQFYGKPEEIELLLRMIGNREKDLRRNALEMGRQIYQESPGRFCKRLEKLWVTWQGSRARADAVTRL